MINVTTELEHLIDSTITIPTIPTTLLAINKIVASPEGSAKQCGEVIVKDPAVAAKVLRLVNSSFYALRNPVSSVPLACSILGLKVIKNLVVQATVLESFGEGPAVEGFDVNWLWDHSLKTAVAARMIAASWPDAGLDKDEAYTCGLVHDVGKMLLLEHQTDRFAQALKLSVRHRIPLAKAEDEVFGFTHAHAVGLLATRWKLAKDLQAAVTHHHATGTEAGDRAKGCLVQCANSIAHQEAQGSGGWLGDVVSDETLAALCLPAEKLAEIRAQVRQASMSV